MTEFSKKIEGIYLLVKIIYVITKQERMSEPVEPGDSSDSSDSSDEGLRDFFANEIATEDGRPGDLEYGYAMLRQPFELAKESAAAERRMLAMVKDPHLRWRQRLTPEQFKEYMAVQHRMDIELSSTRDERRMENVMHLSLDSIPE